MANTDQNIAQLGNTLGDGVTGMTKCTRPLQYGAADSMRQKASNMLHDVSGGFVGHAGVKLDTEHSGSYIEGKSKGITGSGGASVITDAANMSDKWTCGERQDVSGQGIKVTDVIKSSGPGYNFGVDNCQQGTNRAMDLAGK